MYNTGMDRHGKEKQSAFRAEGKGGEGKEKGSCIIIKKGETLSLRLIENRLQKCDKKEIGTLRERFKDIKGGQSDEEL